MRKLIIDRSVPFDPETFIGEGWSIVEQDVRSLALTEIDLDKVRFSTLQKRETSLDGILNLERLKQKTNFIQLDAKVLQALWKNQMLIPLKWRGQKNGKGLPILFSGTKLRHPNGTTHALCLFWKNGNWCWQTTNCLKFGWDPDGPAAAIIPSSKLRFPKLQFIKPFCRLNLIS